MRIRQIALVAEDLQTRAQEVTRLLGPRVGYVDPGVGQFGLENVVIPLEDTFLEIVSPREPGTTAGRLLEKRGGDGGYMVILQVPDFAAARRRLDATAARVVAERHGPNYDFAHIHPKDIGGAIVSIDEMRPAEHWEWGGPDWKAAVDTSVVKGIVGVEIQSRDPEAACARWAEVLGLRRDGLRLPLDGGEIRFTETGDGRGDGLGAIDVEVSDAEEFWRRARAMDLVNEHGVVSVCGTRIYAA